MRVDPQTNLFYNDVAPEGSLRLIDQTVTDWLASFRFRDQTPKVVSALQSKQFAQAHEVDELTNPDVKQAASFPKISVYMTNIRPDTSRRQGPNTFLVNVGPNPVIWKPNLHCSVEPEPNDPRIQGTDNRAFVTTAQDELYLMPWPLSFDMDYQIDILTKNQQDMILLRSALLARFTGVDETYLETCFPGYGKQMIRVTLNQIADTSRLEQGEEERELRSTVGITVHGWIFRIPVRKKTIQNKHFVIIDASGEDPTGLDTLDDGSDFLGFYNDPDNYVFTADGSSLVSVAESPTFAPPNRVLFWQSDDADGNRVTGP